MKGVADLISQVLSNGRAVAPPDVASELEPHPIHVLPSATKRAIRNAERLIRLNSLQNPTESEVQSIRDCVKTIADLGFRPPRNSRECREMIDQLGAAHGDKS